MDSQNRTFLLCVALTNVARELQCRADLAGLARFVKRFVALSLFISTDCVLS
jgi:hypothetical protein